MEIIMKDSMKGRLIGKKFSEIQQNLNVKETEEVVSDYQNLLKKGPSQTFELLLNSTGYSIENTFYSKIIQIIKLSICIIENKGLYLSGEKGTGKSFLYTLCLDKLVKKLSGSLSSALLRGNAKSNPEECKALLEENIILLEEIADDSQTNRDIIGLIKDALESKTFLKCQKTEMKTYTSFILTGNDYSNFTSFLNLNGSQVLTNFPKEFKDKALFDRFPLLLPHYRNLLGPITYTEEDACGVSVHFLCKLFTELKAKENTLLLINVDNTLEPREISIYNTFVSAIAKLFYPRIEEVPSWFIDGWIEFIRHFRELLTENKCYNPFNKKSARLITELLGYKYDEIEFISFDTNRIIIKKEKDSFFSKVALTGFGIEDNKLEYDFYRNNKTENILEIFSISDNGLILKQNAGNFHYESRIYFNNILNFNNRSNKTDEEFNLLFLEKIEADVMKNIPLDSKISFRGIPKFYEYELAHLVKNIFKPKIENKVNFKDFTFEALNIKILNFAHYLK